MLNSDQNKLLFRYLNVLLDSEKKWIFYFSFLGVYLRVPNNMGKVKNSVFGRSNFRPFWNSLWFKNIIKIRYLNVILDLNLASVLKLRIFRAQYLKNNELS